MKDTLRTVGINAAVIGAVFIALYYILNAQIGAVDARVDGVDRKVYDDHADLTAAVSTIQNLASDVKDIKRVVYFAAPNWGVNPNAGKSASTTND